MTQKELNEILEKEEDLCMYRMFTHTGVILRMKYAEFYYKHFGDKFKSLPNNKIHWTQYVNILPLGLIDVIDTFACFGENVIERCALWIRRS